MCSLGYWARRHRTPPCTGLDTVNSNRHRVGSGCPDRGMLIGCSRRKRRRSHLRLEPAGSEFFITEAKKVRRAVGHERLTGYTEPSTGRFTLPGGAMRAMVYRGPYKIRVEEKDLTWLTSGRFGLEVVLG